MTKFDLQLFGGENDPAGQPDATSAQDNQSTPAATEPAATPDAQATGNQNPLDKLSANTILGSDPEADTANPDADSNTDAAEPENQVPESYDLTGVLPEGYELDQEQFAEYSSIAKEFGLSQEAASKIGAMGIKLQQQAADNVINAIIAQREEWGTSAKAELGKDFEAVKKDAAAGLASLEAKIPNLRQVFNETGAGNRVEIIRLLAEVGKLTKEDDGSKLGTGVANSTPSAAKIMYPNMN